MHTALESWLPRDLASLTLELAFDEKSLVDASADSAHRAAMLGNWELVDVWMSIVPRNSRTVSDMIRGVCEGGHHGMLPLVLPNKTQAMIRKFTVTVRNVP